MSNKDLYINKKTFKCLESEIPKGIDWLKIPDEAEECYYFDGSDPEGVEDLCFYKNSLKEVWNDQEDKEFSHWYDFKDKSGVLKYVKTYGKLVWKSNVDDIRIEDESVSENGKSKTLIKSDGGSSDYYKREIPEGMLERWNKDGFIEAKDVMKLFLGNDYNFCNSFKAHCRVQSLREGVGKDGASEKYDLRKAWFFCEDAYNNYLEVNENVKRK